MPFHDWQFWVVTLLMLGGLWLVWRTLAPRRKSSTSDPACPTCTTGSTSSKRKRRVALTIDRQRVK